MFKHPRPRDGADELGDAVEPERLIIQPAAGDLRDRLVVAVRVTNRRKQLLETPEKRMSASQGLRVETIDNAFKPMVLSGVQQVCAPPSLF